ncbi:MAG TPA: hypothetical protein VGK67_04380 [Myxococcales bacterium]|jgi:hypothetical protein
MVILVLLVLGLFGLGASPIALVQVRAQGLEASWTRRILAGLAGLGLLVASHFGYPVPETDGGWGRVIGLPLPAAYFDATGSDYVGPATFLAMVGNLAFWLLAPQACLSMALWARAAKSRLVAGLRWSVPVLGVLLASGTLLGSLAPSPRRPPPQPPAAMSAERPCPAGVEARIKEQREYRREDWRWMRYCEDANGRGRGPWTIWSAEGRVLNSGTMPAWPAPDADAGVRGP